MQAVPVLAESSSSSNYQITETQFNNGTGLQSCSGQYCAQATIGDTAIGNAASSTVTAKFGAISSDSEPLLEVIVDPGESNLGTLTTETTATKTTSIKIRSYQSGGYQLQIVGNAPTYAGHALASPSTPTFSTPGTEQFGINLVANTLPTIGANPLQVPNEQTSFGVVNNDYNTTNKFMYSDGATVAHSNTESGETDYTVSMIINVANDTPAGHYTSDFAAVVIPVY